MLLSDDVNVCDGCETCIPSDARQRWGRNLCLHCRDEALASLRVRPLQREQRNVWEWEHRAGLHPWEDK